MAGRAACHLFVRAVYRERAATRRGRLAECRLARGVVGGPHIGGERQRGLVRDSARWRAARLFPCALELAQEGVAQLRRAVTPRLAAAHHPRAAAVSSPPPY